MAALLLSNACFPAFNRSTVPTVRAVASEQGSIGLRTAEESKVKLGGSELQVTKLGIGAWSWGDTTYWNNFDWDDRKLKAAKAAFDTSIDCGITFFDTAEVYGSRMSLGAISSETLLGRFIKERKQKDPEVEVAIATKYAALPWRLGRQSVISALKDSLARLELSCVDLYQLHWPGIWGNEGYIDGLADAVEQGLVKAVGVSNYSEKRLRAAYDQLKKRGIPLASNQVNYSLIYRLPEENGVKSACDELGISLIAYSPLAQGALTGKYTPKNTPSGPRGRIYTSEFMTRLQPLINRIKEIGDNYGKTPTQVVLNWLVAQGNVVPIPGARNGEQAKEFSGAVGWKLSEEQVEELRAMASEIKPVIGFPVEKLMDNLLSDWNTEIGVGFPLPLQKKPQRVENDLGELLWKNGGVVLNSQTNKKQPKQVAKHGQSNPINSIQDYDALSWVDETLDKDLFSSLLPEIPSSNPAHPNRPLVKFKNEKLVKFDLSEINNVSPPVLPTPTFDQNLESANINKVQFPAEKHTTGWVDRVPVTECSVKTVNSSHCASNQVTNDVDMSWASSSWELGGKTHFAGPEGKCGGNMGRQCETDKEKLTSCSGGCGCSFRNKLSETNSLKRKSRDVEESECRSDATELESAAGDKSAQKATRRSRVAEVHNLSERRRRDRINERMRALQELIPHSNKSDKASMLDEAIEYMKSLQWQLQLLWMGSGMGQMMLPGMQHYMSRFGMGMGPPVHPAISNLVNLSRLPLVDQAMNVTSGTNQAPVSYQNQMVPNSSFVEPYGNYMGFCSLANAPQPTNVFDFGLHSTQQNQLPKPPNNGNVFME
ncbi:Uncharacterized oxidoreductase - chloroplastic [Striga hermonthica]|uniref:Uncharacterized oxidoreductase - chloroplastic n=1 Tax=Striga hermonthica TaxID=68872 RepID=A0A9N7NU04_STRHE|nr:Uncharacterized oxidoreductase - chloroplastic [Striga hermonthica]